MRQIIAAVTRKLLLTIFAPVTVGLLITASASAEPKGSFELSQTIDNITMVNVAVNGSCIGNDIGANTEGKIFTCQGGKWKETKMEADIRLAYASASAGRTPSNNCPGGYRLVSNTRTSTSTYCEGSCFRTDHYTQLCQR